MLLPGENSPKSWLLLTVLVIAIITCIDSTEAKTLDIKLGFDLTQGSNGPSLQFRDFKDTHEFNPRAMKESSSSESSSSSGSGSIQKKPAKHSSDTGEHLRKKDESSKEPEKVISSSESDEGDNNSRDSKRSTRGLRAADFEPEDEHPKIHAKYNSGSNESGRRYRRDVGRFYYRKM